MGGRKRLELPGDAGFGPTTLPYCIALQAKQRVVSGMGFFAGVEVAAEGGVFNFKFVVALLSSWIEAIIALKVSEIR
jgi:hypothetical protein